MPTPQENSVSAFIGMLLLPASRKGEMRRRMRSMEQMNSIPASSLLLTLDLEEDERCSPTYLELASSRLEILIFDMKSIVKNYFTKQPQLIIYALVLTGILSLSTDLTMLQSATAAPRNLSQEADGEMVKGKANLPKSVADDVLQDASQRSGLPTSELRIVQAERRDWPNGCLGLDVPGVFCTAVIVPGWLVTVEAGQQRLVYRTGESGKVKLDETASQIRDAGTIKPASIPTSELPPPLKPGVIFREITSGGIAGRMYETTLLNDGQVLRAQVNFDGTTSQTQTYQISRQQVRQFQQLLEQQQFAQFNQLSYPAPSGAADYITVTLNSLAGTSRYTDINQERLPGPLQKVIQSWNQLKRE